MSEYYARTLNLKVKVTLLIACKVNALLRFRSQKLQFSSRKILTIHTTNYFANGNIT